MTITQTRLNPTIGLVVHTRHPNSVGHLKSPQTIKHLVLTALDGLRGEDDRYLWMANKNVICLRNERVPDVSAVNLPGVQAVHLPHQEDYRVGSSIDFIMDVNLTKRVQGKRVGLGVEQARERLDHELSSALTVDGFTMTPQHISFPRTTGGVRRTVSMDTVLVRGSGTIRDMEAFATLYNVGIGNSRGYGKGMLIATTRSTDEYDAGFQ